MGIRVISGVHEMSDEEFKEELIKKMAQIAIAS